MTAAFLLQSLALSRAGAQGLRSEPRAITLMAVKRPAFEALDAVRLTVAAPQRSETGDAFDVTASVQVHDEGRCEIRAVAREGTPTLLYSGACREAAPAHVVHVRVSALQWSVTDATAIEVVCMRDGVPRRWLLDLPLNAAAGER